jgi:hypothetical protein
MDFAFQTTPQCKVRILIPLPQKRAENSALFYFSLLYCLSIKNAKVAIKKIKRSVLVQIALLTYKIIYESFQ